jgi:hypothetical protein
MAPSSARSCAPSTPATSGASSAGTIDIAKLMTAEPAPFPKAAPPLPKFAVIDLVR